MAKWTPAHPDLFEPLPPAVGLTPLERAKALELLAALLLEAMMGEAAKRAFEVQEVGDDEDHA